MRSFLFVATLLAAPSSDAEPRIVVHSRDGLDLAHYIVDDTMPVMDGTMPVINDARADSRTIYLNRYGAKLQPGPNDARSGRSSLINKPASIPPWNATPEHWSETVTCLREIFAPFDVQLTETDPGDVPHVEAIFGGAPSMLGLSVLAGGVSPFSTSCSVVENSVVFAFTDVLPDSPKVICEVMAQEIAHSYGLDHELLASDPMTYLSYAGQRSFQDADAECGELSARPCGVPGFTSCRATQNSYELLAQRIGLANTSSADAADDTSDNAVGCSAGQGAGWLEGLLVVALRSRRRSYRGNQGPAVEA